MTNKCPACGQAIKTVKKQLKFKTGGASIPQMVSRKREMSKSELMAMLHKAVKNTK